MLAVNLLFVVSGVLSQQCLTVSFEGGGSHGAYEAGALLTMVNTLAASSVAYNVISGISTGALNTAAAVQYPIGQEKAMAQYMVDTWLNIGGQDNIYVQWPGGYAQAILFEPALYDTRPLKAFVTSKTTKGINRPFTVGSTSLNTGNFKNYDETIGNSNLVEAVMSSAAPPFFFPYQLFQGDVMADGGCLINLDVFEAINKCYKIVNDYSKITVDLLFDSKVETLPSSYSFNTLQVFGRVFEINSYNGGIWYYNQAKLDYPGVKFRYVVIPTQDMPGGIVPLNFTQSVLVQEIQMGQTDAANVIKLGENGAEVLQAAYEKIKANRVIP